MTVATVYCCDKYGKPKERFDSPAAARRALHHKRKFRHHRWPSVYHCPCGSYHLTAGPAS